MLRLLFIALLAGVLGCSGGNGNGDVGGDDAYDGKSGDGDGDVDGNGNGDDAGAGGDDAGVGGDVLGLFCHQFASWGSGNSFAL